MPTDLELIRSFVNLSADAKEVLLRLLDFTQSNDTVTWSFSGGTSVTVDSIPKMLADFDAEIDGTFQGFEENFGGVYSSAITRDSNGIITGGTITFNSGHVLEMVYTRSSTNLLESVAWTLKAGTTTLASGTKAITRDINGQIESIA